MSTTKEIAAVHDMEQAGPLGLGTVRYEGDLWNLREVDQLQSLSEAIPVRGRRVRPKGGAE